MVHPFLSLYAREDVVISRSLAHSDRDFVCSLLVINLVFFLFLYPIFRLLSEDRTSCNGNPCFNRVLIVVGDTFRNSDHSGTVLVTPSRVSFVALGSCAFLLEVYLVLAGAVRANSNGHPLSSRIARLGDAIPMRSAQSLRTRVSPL